MDFKSLTGSAQNKLNTNQILRNQLLWMMLLRIILYTLLLGINYLFENEEFDVIVLPTHILAIFLQFVYLTTIVSAFYLVSFTGNLRKFGFAQALLDTFFVTLLVFFSGSSSSIFISVFFFPIVAGGLILPRKGGLFAAAAASLQYGFLLIIEVNGFYPTYIQDYIPQTSVSTMTMINHFAVNGLTFFLAAILSALFGLRLKTTEDALSHSIEKFDQLSILYKQVFDNISTGILTIDNKNTITSANRAIETITGLTPAAQIGKKLNTLFSDFDLTSPNARQTTDFLKSNGKLVRIGYSFMNIQQPKGSPGSTNIANKIITLRDISEIERLERQVRQTEKLAAIGMMSASIAHDFRNPLTAISGSAQVLAEDFLASDTANHTNYELTSIILRESNRLIETIADFLKFSRPEHVDKEWFSLAQCIDEVLQMCRADLRWPSGSEIIVNIDKTLDIWADERQMFTVFNHLIQNGLAFCPKGQEQIRISAHETNSDEGREALIITISDNGTGVPLGEREIIFEPFFTSRPNGTGLGLAIINQTIASHSGTITIGESETGGALFTLSFPLPVLTD